MSLYRLQYSTVQVLIYLTLYITECLKKLQKSGSKAAGLQEMYSLAIARFDIPGGDWAGGNAGTSTNIILKNCSFRNTLRC